MEYQPKKNDTHIVCRHFNESDHNGLVSLQALVLNFARDTKIQKRVSEYA